MQEKELPEIMSPTQVAAFLMVDVSSVYRYTKRGLIDHFHIGLKKIGIPRQAVYDFLNLTNGGMEE